MVSVVTSSPSPLSPIPSRRRAFTLIELMVAVSLLVVIILSVGIVFKSTGNAVGLGQATGEMFAKVRAINQQIISDVHGMDRNGFLIIRCRFDNSDPNRFRRYDQISFISTGKFPNRTGAYQPAQVFADNSTSSSARIWYGQLAIQKDALPTDENIATSLSSPPNPTIASSTDPAYESGFWLGRQAMLLLNPPPAAPPPGSTYPAGYKLITYQPATTAADFYTAGTSNGGFENGLLPSISASRIAVAYTTVPQIMTDTTWNSSTQLAFNAYCYRLRTLPSPTTTAISDGGSPASPYLPNGVLRMHPVFATGVPSFAIDWTDGTPDVNGNLQWYGYNGGPQNSYNVEMKAPGNGSGQYYAQAHVTAYTGLGGNKKIEYPGTAGNSYEAVFAPVNSTLWPKALRFTYRITDSNDRLNGGRSFVCVVDLPPPLH